MKNGKSLLIVAPILFSIATTTTVNAASINNGVTVTNATTSGNSSQRGVSESLGGNYAVQVSSSVPVPVYNVNGEKQSRALGSGTTWATHDQIVFKDNAGNVTGLYYRVSTTEYVKASDVYFYAPAVQNVKVVSQQPASLVDHTGRPITSRALAQNTKWYSDQVIKIGGRIYYRVATDEFAALGSVEPY